MERIEVFFLDTTHIPVKIFLLSLVSLLSSSEQERCDRIVSQARKEEYVLGHVLSRLVMSKISGVSPKEVPLFFFKDQQPRWQGNGNYFMSLSHCKGCVVFAVSDAPLGVDVENENRIVLNDMKIAKRFFSSDECRTLEGSSRTDRQRIFYVYWTLYEAVIKMGFFEAPEKIQKKTFHHHSFIISLAYTGDPKKIHFSTVDDTFIGLDTEFSRSATLTG